MVLLNIAEGQISGTVVTAANTGGGSGDAFKTVSKTVNGNITFDNSHPHRGTNAYHIVAGVGDTAVVGAGVASSTSTTGSRGEHYGYLRAAPTAVVDSYVQMRTAGSPSRAFAIGIAVSRRWSVYDSGAAIIFTSAVTDLVPLGAHGFRARCVPGTGTNDGTIVVDLIDGSGNVIGTGFSASNVNAGTLPVNEYRVGKANSTGSMDVDVDDIRFDDSTGASYLPALSANNPPTVNAGVDQTVDVGTLVNLAGTDSDTDGTVTTRLWSIAGGPTSPAITNNAQAAASVTFAAPGHYTCRYTATDNLGAYTSDDMLVFVRAASGRPESVDSNAGAFTIVGGSATQAAALADESDTTYIESSDNPSGAAIVTTVTPMTSGGKRVLVRYRESAASPARSLLVEVLQGVTVIATFTPPAPTIAWQDATYDLTTSEVAAVTNLNDLHLRITAS
jgi:hypothetical protein